jgi:hypothetical protein
MGENRWHNDEQHDRKDDTLNHAAYITCNTGLFSITSSTEPGEKPDDLRSLPLYEIVRFTENHVTEGSSKPRDSPENGES